MKYRCVYRSVIVETRDQSGRARGTLMNTTWNEYKLRPTQLSQQFENKMFQYDRSALRFVQIFWSYHSNEKQLIYTRLFDSDGGSSVSWGREGEQIEEKVASGRHKCWCLNWFLEKSWSLAVRIGQFLKSHFRMSKVYLGNWSITGHQSDRKERLIQIERFHGLGMPWSVALRFLQLAHGRV